MDLSEDKKHIILLAIISVLFVLLATGLAVPAETSAETTIFTS